MKFIPQKRYLNVLSQCYIPQSSESASKTLKAPPQREMFGGATTDRTASRQPAATETSSFRERENFSINEIP